MWGIPPPDHGAAEARSLHMNRKCEILSSMLRRALTWDPPLFVTVLALFAVIGAVSLAMAGSVTPYALFLATICSAAQWSRKRRLGADPRKS